MDNMNCYAVATKAAVKLESIIWNKSLCKDIEKLSGNYQTSRLESFHSLINYFAPKQLCFSFHGMYCR